MSKPILALDVDGVFSPVTVGDELPPYDVWPEDQWSRATSPGSWMLYVAKPVIAFLREIHNEKLCDIHWHTTWEGSAPLILGRDFDLPEWPLLFPSGLESATTEWSKQEAIENTLASGKKVIWIDDHIDRKKTLKSFQPLVTHPKLTLISPLTHRGLEQKHLDQIKSNL